MDKTYRYDLFLEETCGWIMEVTEDTYIRALVNIESVLGWPVIYVHGIKYFVTKRLRSEKSAIN